MEGIKKRRFVFCCHKWVAVVRAGKDGMGRLPENRPVPGKREKSARDGERAGGRQKENRTGSRPGKTFRQMGREIPVLLAARR